jgi:hypothetical protein
LQHRRFSHSGRLYLAVPCDLSLNLCLSVLSMTKPLY